MTRALRLPAAALLLGGLVFAQNAEQSPARETSEPDGMVLIPAGELTMGRTQTTPDDETGMRPRILLDDRPPHTVRLDAFYMDRHEATHAEYARFVEATGHPRPYHWLEGKPPPGRADYPIYNIDWSDAKIYCEWASKRLPTEAEWERAARGGVEGAAYPWGDEKPTAIRARFATTDGPGPVERHPPNAFGLHDMAGGVAEWCSDWFERTYYENSPSENPQGPVDGLYKVIRGGAWSDGSRRVTVFFRNWVRPNQRTPNIGFRCVQAAH